jgi:hypothetical protein
MPILKMPAALRWLWVICILLLLMMTSYRVFLVLIFSISSSPKMSIIWSGILYDTGVIALIGFLFFVLSFSKKLHPYRSKNGLQFSLVYFSVSLFLILFFYSLDLVSIKTFGQRLSGTKFLSLFKGNPRRIDFLANFPVLAFVVGATLSIWVWWLLIKFLHLRLGIMDRAIRKTQRFGWHSATLIILLFLFWLGRMMIISYEVPGQIIVARSLETALKVNPVLSLLFL